MIMLIRLLLIKIIMIIAGVDILTIQETFCFSMYQKRALLFTSHLKVLAKCYNGRTFPTDIDDTDNLALLSKKIFFPYISSKYTVHILETFMYLKWFFKKPQKGYFNHISVYNFFFQFKNCFTPLLFCFTLEDSCLSLYVLDLSMNIFLLAALTFIVRLNSISNSKFVSTSAEPNDNLVMPPMINLPSYK